MEDWSGGMVEGNGLCRTVKISVLVGILILIAGLVLCLNFTGSFVAEPPYEIIPTTTPISSVSSMSLYNTPPVIHVGETTNQLEEHPQDLSLTHTMTPAAPIPSSDPNVKPSHQTPNTISQINALVLKAVAMEEKGNSAVINRTVVQEGDRVEGFTVLSIERRGVWLEQQKAKQFLTFPEEHLS